MTESAELFDAIAHPMRIKILKILEKEPATFATLKRQLNLDSSGNLDHHLKKLGSLITVQNGMYTLADAGKQALASVSAVETWKESERLRLKAFAEKPLAVNILIILTLAAAIIAALLVAQVTFTSAFNVPFLPTIYSLATIISVLSLIGLLFGKRWGWTFAVVQAALVIAYSVVPMYYDFYLVIFRSITSTENPSSLVWIATSALVIVELSIMLVAARKPVKEFLGAQHATPLRKRALAGGTLAVLSGMLEMYAGIGYNFAPGDGRGGGAQLGILGDFLVASALLLVMGGAAVFLRKYTLGGVLIIAFSLFPTPYYIVAIYFNLILLTPIIPITIIVIIIIGIMPYVAAALAFLSRSKTNKQLLPHSDR
jgi:hypothetical protein